MFVVGNAWQPGDQGPLTRARTAAAHSSVALTAQRYHTGTRAAMTTAGVDRNEVLLDTTLAGLASEQDCVLANSQRRLRIERYGLRPSVAGTAPALRAADVQEMGRRKYSFLRALPTRSFAASEASTGRPVGQRAWTPGVPAVDDSCTDVLARLQLNRSVSTPRPISSTVSLGRCGRQPRRYGPVWRCRHTYSLALLALVQENFASRPFNLHPKGVRHTPFTFARINDDI